MIFRSRLGNLVYGKSLLLLLLSQSSGATPRRGPPLPGDGTRHPMSGSQRHAARPGSQERVAYHRNRPELGLTRNFSVASQAPNPLGAGRRGLLGAPRCGACPAAPARQASWRGYRPGVAGTVPSQASPQQVLSLIAAAGRRRGLGGRWQSMCEDPFTRGRVPPVPQPAGRGTERQSTTSASLTTHRATVEAATTTTTTACGADGAGNEQVASLKHRVGVDVPIPARRPRQR